MKPGKFYTQRYSIDEYETFTATLFYTGYVFINENGNTRLNIGDLCLGDVVGKPREATREERLEFEQLLLQRQNQAYIDEKTFMEARRMIDIYRSKE